MKKARKAKAEKQEQALLLLDSIDDEYLSEALSLHVTVTDARNKAKSPRLVFKRLSVLAACLLVVAALAPLSFILSMTLGGGCGSGEEDFGGDRVDGDHFNGTEDNEGAVIYKSFSVGTSLQTERGVITFLSFDRGVITLLISPAQEGNTEIFLTGIDDKSYYYSNYATSDNCGEYVEGVSVFTENFTETDQGQRVTVDLSAFIEKSGLAFDELLLTVSGFGALELSK